MKSLPNQHGGRKWRRVSPKYPCHICGKPDWCLISPDGTVAACMRIGIGAFRTKAGRSGQTFHFHRLNGQPGTAAPLPRTSGQAPPPTGDELVTAVRAALGLFGG